MEEQALTNIQQLTQVIRERRTTRSYIDRPVTTETVMELLKAASEKIPSDWEDPNARFILVSSQQAKEKVVSKMMEALQEQTLYRLMPKKLNQSFASKILSIPTYLVVVQKTGQDAIKNDRDYAAISAMLHSYSLLAWERGIGLVWNTEAFMQKQVFMNALELEDNERIVCTLFMGYNDRVPKTGKRTAAEKKVTFI
ncbi:nitroreductase family protein [Paenibacillus radicibacter]|uniref:nitroreductase family protein n=1 Tax=Paenibacillus radicibacter TaxID=2972488 RepID=UPI0021595B06|nr:nitroreductase family protein [Paenibacillus radicibacter]